MALSRCFPAGDDDFRRGLGAANGCLASRDNLLTIPSRDDSSPSSSVVLVNSP